MVIKRFSGRNGWVLLNTIDKLWEGTGDSDEVKMINISLFLVEFILLSFSIHFVREVGNDKIKEIYPI